MRIEMRRFGKLFESGKVKRKKKCSFGGTRFSSYYYCDSSPCIDRY